MPEMHEFFKIPLLFEHFDEHKQVDNTISFLDFLSLHYLNGNPKDADYEKDMKLPFKTTDCSANNAVAHYIPKTTLNDTLNTNEIIEKPFFFSHSLYYTSSYLSQIWQPPKAC